VHSVPLLQFSDMGPLKQAHGFARNMQWTLEGTSSPSSSTFTLQSNEDTLALWAHPFSAAVKVAFGGGGRGGLVVRQH
jgi:glucose-6-phosphate 1-epimerase